MSETTPGFEELLARLEDRVRALEQGDLSLAEALAVFEDGIGLARDCHERLDASRRQILELRGEREL